MHPESRRSGRDRSFTRKPPGRKPVDREKTAPREARPGAIQKGQDAKRRQGRDPCRGIEEEEETGGHHVRERPQRIKAPAPALARLAPWRRQASRKVDVPGIPAMGRERIGPNHMGVSSR